MGQKVKGSFFRSCMANLIVASIAAGIVLQLIEFISWVLSVYYGREFCSVTGLTWGKSILISAILIYVLPCILVAITSLSSRLRSKGSPQIC